MKPHAGGPLENLGEIATEATALALTATELYVCRGDSIVAMPKGGGAIRTVAATGHACQRRGGIGGAPPDFIIAGDKLY